MATCVYLVYVILRWVSKWTTLAVLLALLVIGGVELNPGPTVEELQKKLGAKQILLVCKDTSEARRTGLYEFDHARRQGRVDWQSVLGAFQATYVEFEEFGNPGLFPVDHAFSGLTRRVFTAGEVHLVTVRKGGAAEAAPPDVVDYLCDKFGDALRHCHSELAPGAAREGPLNPEILDPDITEHMPLHGHEETCLCAVATLAQIFRRWRTRGLTQNSEFRRGLAYMLVLSGPRSGWLQSAEARRNADWL
ncbi:hypothetical protein WJX72_000786 [[Myrmecia] bisecta]|uniref:Uncharacterized protein n=1 Tax=[Myrmecia] bisecta TaxID=41462 RepID=A0AAW1P738_9CHLO